MITEKVIKELSFWLRIDGARVVAVIDNVKRSGRLQAQDIRELTSVGLPVIKVIAAVLREPVDKAYDAIRDGEITYQDLIMILGIIAQDWKYREQLAKTGRNG